MKLNYLKVSENSHKSETETVHLQNLAVHNKNSENQSLNPKLQRTAVPSHLSSLASSTVPVDAPLPNP